MAFRFEFDEPFELGTARILHEQLDRAKLQLTGGADPVTAVHEARKCFKRCRALLRLVRAGLSNSAFNKANGQIRDLARLLAQSRDIDVMPETLAYLRQGHAASSPAMVKRVELAIANAREQLGGTSTASPIEQAVVRLGKIKDVIAAITFTDCKLDTVTAGIECEIANFAERMKEAAAASSDDAYHEWRKRAQIHRRHGELLSAAWPEALEPRIAAAKQLADLLGLDHDLSVLADFVASPLGKPATVRDGEKIRSFCKTEQAALRRKAHALGALLTAEPPISLGQRIAAYWVVRCEHADHLAGATE